MKNIKKTAGKLFAMILTVAVSVSCAVSTGIFTASAYTAPSIYAQHGNCRNHAAFHYLKDN